MIPVVILAGGLGTRLRSVVADRPKVLAPVAGQPFLGHLLRRLAAEGVHDVVLSTGYLGEQIAAFVETHAPEDVRVRCVQETTPLGTGGALAHAARHAGLDTPFVAMNGDTFFGGAVITLVEAHRNAPGAEATLALARVTHADRYGRVLFAASPDDPVRVTGFAEKDTAGTGEKPVWINAGVYVLAPSVLGSIPPNEKVSLERVVFPELVARGTLWARRFPDAPFLDIGTPEDYARAAEAIGHGG
ncbi:MAG: NTP transferase domain-containing protein [Rhodothermaceae bacterium]|nr:NTP transferase domain-containing protein [Rhodothermaceae bacterium]